MASSVSSPHQRQNRQEIRKTDPLSQSLYPLSKIKQAEFWSHLSFLINAGISESIRKKINRLLRYDGSVHWPVLKFAFTFFAYINSSHCIIKTLNHSNHHLADEYTSLLAMDFMEQKFQ